MPLFGSNKEGTLVVYCGKAGVPITIYVLDEQEKRIQPYVFETQRIGKSLCAVTLKVKQGSYEVIEPKHPEFDGQKIYVSAGYIREVNLLFDY